MLRHIDALAVFALLWVALGVAQPAYAQQRTFINGGFEQNDPRGPGTPTFQIYNQTAVPEWSDDTGFIELWDSGFQSTPAYEGDVFAELNAHSPGSLFQEICLINGETLSWTFAHRARISSGTNPQTVFFEIADSSNVQIQALTSQTSLKGAGWSVNSGSVTYTGPTGVSRARFFTTDPGSTGNFLDDLQFDISAFAQLSAASGQNFEAAGGSVPHVEIFGRIDVATTIPVSVTGGTADAGDYTQTAASINVPAGLYNGESFPLPISIIDDAISEVDDTIEFTLGTPSTGEIIYAAPICDGTTPPTTSATYTIINDDGRLEANKSVEMYNTGTEDIYSIPGEDVIYTIRITNTGDIDVDSGSVFLADKLPPELLFYNGDIDDAGPELNAVGFLDSGSGLSFNYATDIGYSDSTTQPSSMADCNFNPAVGYVDTIKFLCFAPQGSFLEGDPDPYIEITYRMQIK